MNENQSNRGFAAAMRSAAKPARSHQAKPSDDHVPRRTIRAQQPVDKDKLLVGSVSGVIRHHFGGQVALELPRGKCWAAVSPEDRCEAQARAIVSKTIEHIVIKDKRVTSPSTLQADLVTAVSKVLMDKRGQLRTQPRSTHRAGFVVKVPRSKKQKAGDGRPEARIKRAKTARLLRRQMAHAA